MAIDRLRQAIARLRIVIENNFLYPNGTEIMDTKQISSENAR